MSLEWIGAKKSGGEKSPDGASADEPRLAAICLGEEKNVGSTSFRGGRAGVFWERSFFRGRGKPCHAGANTPSVFGG